MRTLLVIILHIYEKYNNDVITENIFSKITLMCDSQLANIEQGN